jgi:hypothetical protein
MREPSYSLPIVCCGQVRSAEVHAASASWAANPSIERTSQSGLRPLCAAAHVER